MNVAGVIKDWLLIGVSSAIFAAPISRISLLGYALAFAGVCVYNYHKLEQMKSGHASKRKDAPTEDLEATQQLVEEDPTSPKPRTGEEGALPRT
eukprot:scaffold1911_cov397-Prasinococcus_capsulatus_cf.AAC.23